MQLIMIGWLTLIEDDSVGKDVAHGKVNVFGLDDVVQKLVTLTLTVVEPISSLKRIDKLSQLTVTQNSSLLIEKAISTLVEI